MFVKHALNIFMLYTPNHLSCSACLMSTTQAVFCRFQDYPTLDVSDQGSIRTVHLAFLPLTASGQCTCIYCMYLSVFLICHSPACRWQRIPLNFVATVHPCCVSGASQVWILLLLCPTSLSGCATTSVGGSRPLWCRNEDHSGGTTRSTLLSLIIHIHVTCIGCILSYNSDAKPLLLSVNVSFIKQIEVCSLQLYTFVLCFCTYLCI